MVIYLEIWIICILIIIKGYEMKNWKELEEATKEMLVNDNAKTVPGSGSTKGEEDVIGRAIIAQTKYSENTNISILRKDLDRLKEAAALHNKLPMFITFNNGDHLISLLNDNDIIPRVIELARIAKSLEKQSDSLKLISEPKQLMEFKKDFNQLLRTFNLLKDWYETDFNILATKIQTKEKDVLICDLFEGI